MSLRVEEEDDEDEELGFSFTVIDRRRRDSCASCVCGRSFDVEMFFVEEAICLRAEANEDDESESWGFLSPRGWEEE